jgi:hypothetical protein
MKHICSVLIFILVGLCSQLICNKENIVIFTIVGLCSQMHFLCYIFLYFLY